LDGAYEAKRDALQTEADAIDDDLIKTYAECTARIVDVFARAAALADRVGRELPAIPPVLQNSANSTPLSLVCCRMSCSSPSTANKNFGRRNPQARSPLTLRSPWCYRTQVPDSPILQFNSNVARDRERAAAVRRILSARDPDLGGTAERRGTRACCAHGLISSAPELPVHGPVLFRRVLFKFIPSVVPTA
jgi:hypothetical protein